MLCSLQVEKDLGHRLLVFNRLIYESDMNFPIYVTRIYRFTEGSTFNAASKLAAKVE